MAVFHVQTTTSGVSAVPESSKEQAVAMATASLVAQVTNQNDHVESSAFQHEK